MQDPNKTESPGVIERVMTTLGNLASLAMPRHLSKREQGKTLQAQVEEARRVAIKPVPTFRHETAKLSPNLKVKTGKDGKLVKLKVGFPEMLTERLEAGTRREIHPMPRSKYAQNALLRGLLKMRRLEAEQPA